jgi:hypothetical protein
VGEKAMSHITNWAREGRFLKSIRFDNCGAFQESASENCV